MENVVESLGDEHDVHATSREVSGHQAVVDKVLSKPGIVLHPWRTSRENFLGSFRESEHGRSSLAADVVGGSYLK